MSTSEDILAKAKEYARWADATLGKATANLVDRADVQSNLAVAYALIALVEHMEPSTPGVINLHASPPPFYGIATVTLDVAWEDVPDMAVLTDDPRWENFNSNAHEYMDIASGFLTVEVDESSCTIQLPDWLRLQRRKE